MLQQFYRKRLDLHEPIGESQPRRWDEWLWSSKTLRTPKIPRYLRILCTADLGTQPLIFCNASEAGYGVVTYVNVLVSASLTYGKLLFSTSRVAPLKTVTDPRLEMASARLAAGSHRTPDEWAWIMFDKKHFWIDFSNIPHHVCNTRTIRLAEIQMVQALTVAPNKAENEFCTLWIERYLFTQIFQNLVCWTKIPNHGWNTLANASGNWAVTKNRIDADVG